MSAFFVTQPVMVLYDWLAARVGMAWSTDFCAIGRVVDRQLVGVVGYNSFTGASCQMHMAGEGRWMTREFLQRAFHYPFLAWGFPMVFGTVPSGNTRALDIDRRLGFKELIYIPGAHPDGGLHLLQMLREDCRWISGDAHGQQVRAEAA